MQRCLALVRERLLHEEATLSRPEPQLLLQINGRLLGPDREPDGNGVFVVLDDLVVPR